MSVFLNKCFNILKNIDEFLKNNENYENKPFCDSNDIILYRDTENIVENTKNIITSFVLSKYDNNLSKSPKELIKIFICCYIVCIKFYSDCTLYKPYSYFCNLLNFSKKDMKDLIKYEKEILKNFDYFSNYKL
jgi:hypothetical protein